LLQECLIQNENDRTEIIAKKYGGKRIDDFVPDDLATLRSDGRFPYSWQVDLKRVNPTRFVGYVFGALVGLSIFIQGAISLVVWVARGFNR
jgi:hypothetical protein